MQNHDETTDDRNDCHWRQVRDLLKQVGLSNAELDACRKENERLEKLVEELHARVEVWATTSGGGVVLERAAFEALELSREEFKYETQCLTRRLKAAEASCTSLSDALETLTKSKQDMEAELEQTKLALKAYSDDLVATWTEKVERLDAENAELQETLKDARRTHAQQLDKQEAELVELRKVVHRQQDIIDSKKSEVSLEQALRAMMESDHRFALERQPVLRLAEEMALMRGKIAEMETNERLLKSRLEKVELGTPTEQSPRTPDVTTVEDKYLCALAFPSQLAASMTPSGRTLSDLSPRYNLQRRIEAVPRVFGSLERAGGDYGRAKAMYEEEIKKNAKVAKC